MSEFNLEELISRLKNLATLEVKNGESVIHVTAEAAECIKEIAHEAADAIENTSKAYQMMAEAYEAEVTKQGWISVTERLPRNKTEVLAYYGFVHDGEMSRCRFIGVLKYFTIDANPHWQHESIGLTVTHWMPLPEPPKEGEDNV